VFVDWGLKIVGLLSVNCPKVKVGRYVISANITNAIYYQSTDYKYKNMLIKKGGAARHFYEGGMLGVENKEYMTTAATL